MKKKPEEPKRKGVAYGYTRVSSEDQADSGKGLTAQKEEIEKHYVKHLQDEGVAWGGLFTDPAVSGKIPLMERLHGKQLYDLLDKGDHVIVAKVDRAFRSLADLCATLEYWAKLDVSFHVIDLKFDTSTPVGRLVLQILGAIGEFERKLAGQRTQAVRRIALREGKAANGFRKIGYHFQGIKGHRVQVPDRLEQKLISKMVGWWLKGASFVYIYHWLIAHHIRTREGREWSAKRIERAIKQWLAREEKSTSAPLESAAAIPASQCPATAAESTAPKSASPASSDPAPQ